MGKKGYTLQTILLALPTHKKKWKKENLYVREQRGEAEKWKKENLYVRGQRGEAVNEGTFGAAREEYLASFHFL
jgi:hypothetical protein